MNDVVTNILAVIGAVSCGIWAVKAIRFLVAKGRGRSAEPDSADLAAIAAAIYAVVGPHRLLSVEPDGTVGTGAIATALGPTVQAGAEPDDADLCAMTAAVYAVAGPFQSLHVVADPVEDPSTDDLAAINAAIFASVGPNYRILHIGRSV